MIQMCILVGHFGLLLSREWIHSGLLFRFLPSLLLLLFYHYVHFLVLHFYFLELLYLQFHLKNFFLFLLIFTFFIFFIFFYFFLFFYFLLIFIFFITYPSSSFISSFTTFSGCSNNTNQHKKFWVVCFKNTIATITFFFKN